MKKSKPVALKKSKVIEAILSALGGQFENYVATSKKTRATGNDAHTKAEGKYDTRSTEENYLADGQAKQALAARSALDAIAKLPLREFTADTPLDLGALVELQFPGEIMWFFLAPAAGGLEVTVAKRLITVLTLDSPLGNQLKGRKPGDSTQRPAAKIIAAL
jgi:hypothetical protein